MLRTTFNFNKTFSRHITPVNLKHSDQVCLSKTLRFSNFANVFTDTIILLNLPFHVCHGASISRNLLEYAQRREKKGLILKISGQLTEIFSRVTKLNRGILICKVNTPPGILLPGDVSVRWGYSISRRLPSGKRCSCLGRVRRRTPSTYLALILSASTPEMSKLLW